MVAIASLVDAHLLPPAVSDVLGDAAAAGCSNGAAAAGGGRSASAASASGTSCSYGWVLHRASLLLWRVDDGLGAVVRRLTLPEAPAGGAHVQIVDHGGGSSALTVIVATGSGCLYVWLDANFPAAPYAQRLFTSSSTGDDASDDEAKLVVALTAASADASGGAGGSPAFVAVVASADGGLHLYHGSGSGVFPRTFHRAPPPPSGVLQAGVLGAIGSAVKAMYGEAFDPLHSVQRSRGSDAPARAMQLLPLDGSRWKLLILTADSLDCWLLGSMGQASSEALLWSFSIRNVLGTQLGASELDLLTMAAAGAQARDSSSSGSSGGGSSGGSARPPGASQAAVYVWCAHTDAASIKFQHSVACFAVEEGSTLPRLLACSTLGADARLPQPQQHMRWALAAHARLPSCLMLAANGSVLEWQRPAGGPPRLLGTGSTDNLAITCTGGAASDNWQLLNSKYGVLEFSAGGSPAAVAQDALAAAAAAGGSCSVGPEQLAAARALLHKAVEVMAKECAAGYPYRELAAGLADALESLGVLAAPAGRQQLLTMSASLADNLPQSGTLASSHLRSLLADKQMRHSLLLVALQEGGVLTQLPPAEAAVLLQHAQQLAAAAEVLQWQRENEAASKDEAADAAQGEAALASAAAIKAAGSLAAAAAGGEDREDSAWAVFFGRPTLGIPALFQAVATQAGEIRHTLASAADRSSMAAQTAQLLGLAGVLEAAVSGAEALAAQQRADMPDDMRHAATAGPSWLAGPGPRQAWAQLAEGCLLAQHDLPSLDQQLLLARGAHLPSLTALLAGLAATLEQQASRDAQLQASYEALPWEHGAVLLGVAKAELAELSECGALQAAAEASHAGDYSSPSYQAAKQALVWPLQQLAVTHKCHELLYEVSELVEGTGLLPPGQLQGLMKRELQGSRGELAPDSFTGYVMQRLYHEHHMQELLHLGQQGFKAQLQAFLATRPGLLWMSQVQAGDVASAASSLAAAAAGCRGSVQQATRLLCLTRIAAQAAGPLAAGGERLKSQAAARLQQLQLQSDVLPGRDTAAPMTTQQLAAAALQAAARAQAGSTAEGGGLVGGAAAVAAVEALALDVQQRDSEGYRQLWHDAWKAALQHTPLAQLAAQGAGDAAQRWQSDEYRGAAEGCALFQAFVRAAAAQQQAAADVSAAHELELVANSLLRQLQQQGGSTSEAGALQDVLHAAARAAGFEAAA